MRKWPAAARGRGWSLCGTTDNRSRLEVTAAGCSSSVSPKKEELSNDLMVLFCFFSRSSAVGIGGKKEGQPVLENGRAQREVVSDYFISEH